MALEKDAARDEESNRTGTVGKALGLLDRVAVFGRPVRFSELQMVSGMPKATLARLLQTLVSENMLAYDGERRVYIMGARLIGLAQAAWRDFSIAPVARPHVRALAQRIGEAVYLSKLDCGQCVCLDRGAPDDLAAIFPSIDRVYPSYCTAVGKAMIACLPQDAQNRALTQQSFHPLTDATITDKPTLKAEFQRILDQGYATEDEEHVRGIIAIAVPILSEGGAVLGGLGVHAPDRRTTHQTLRSFLPALHETATAIARDAAKSQFPEIKTKTA